MTAAFAETPIFDGLFAEVDDVKRQLVLVAIADKPHAAATEVDVLLARVFPEPDCCDGCGTYDDTLTHTVTGALRCRGCLDAIALDAGGDRT